MPHFTARTLLLHSLLTMFVLGFVTVSSPSIAGPTVHNNAGDPSDGCPAQKGCPLASFTLSLASLSIGDSPVGYC